MIVSVLRGLSTRLADIGQRGRRRSDVGSADTSVARTEPAVPGRAAPAGGGSGAGGGGDRLLVRPIFVLAPVRSGSTLLRLLLDGHSQLHAPHELHFRRLEVQPNTKLAGRAMKELGLERRDLEHLLWDRVMHWDLARSGKRHIVEKTPANVFAWRRIAECWPDARFIFLLRHPVSIVRSWHESDPEKRTLEEAGSEALEYMNAVEEARGSLEGHTVRYESLTADAEGTMQGICAFLHVPWEPDMLRYGDRAEGKLRRGLGDWRAKIRSGVVQAGRELPSSTEIPDYLRPICEKWGYQ